MFQTLQHGLIGFKSDKIIYGAGKGVITAENGEMITWVANDIGRSDDNGVIRYRGLTFFNTANTSSTGGGKLAFLNNMEALFITQVNVRAGYKDVGVEINQLTCSLFSKDLYSM
jgi:hypothetical protein